MVSTNCTSPVWTICSLTSPVSKSKTNRVSLQTYASGMSFMTTC